MSNRSLTSHPVHTSFFISFDWMWTYRICAHGPEVGCQSEKGKAVKDCTIHQAVGEVLEWNQHDEHHDKVRKENKQPCDNATDNATGVPNKPHGALLVMTGRNTLNGLQAVRLLLNVPEPRCWTSHPITKASCWWDTQQERDRKLLCSLGFFSGQNCWSPH